MAGNLCYAEIHILVKGGGCVLIIMGIGALLLVFAVMQGIAVAVTSDSPVAKARQEALDRGDYVTAQAAKKELEQKQQQIIALGGATVVMILIFYAISRITG